MKPHGLQLVSTCLFINPKGLIHLCNVFICLCVALLNPLEEISTQNGPPKENNKIISINFGGRKEKKYFFVRIFDISPCVFTQISIETYQFCIQRVPIMHTFNGPRYPKNKKYLKYPTYHIFSRISCFCGRRVRQKYAERVLVGFGI